MGTEILQETVVQAGWMGDFNPAVWVVIGVALTCVLWGRRVLRMRGRWRSF